MKSFSDLSVADLRRVIALKEQIESLEGQLEAIAGECSADAASPAEAPAPAKRAKRRVCPQRIGANLSKPSPGRERCDGQKRLETTRLRRNGA